MRDGRMRARRHGRLRARREEGLALLATLLILVLAGGIALAAISDSEEEMKAGGRGRSSMKSLYAAESGVELAETRVVPPRDLSAFSFTLDGFTIQSRSRSQATPQSIAEGGLGKPPDGYAINVGSGFVNETFEINVTAAQAALPTTELEVRVGVLAANSGTF